MEALTEARRAKLIELCLIALRRTPIPAPADTENEVTFTNRCLAPLMQNFLEGLGFPGLVPIGTGGPSIITCRVLGADFYADLGISYLRTPILAVEVKFLRGMRRQYSIATAIGQSLLYTQRYHASAVMLIDAENRSTDADILAAQELLDGFKLPLIVRRATREGVLSPHPE